MKKLFKIAAIALTTIFAAGVVACNNNGDDIQEPTLDVSTPTILFTSEGGSQPVIVTGVDWSATASADWIELSQSSGVAGASFTVTAGKTFEIRIGTITVTGGTGAPKTIEVTQTGLEEPLPAPTGLLSEDVTHRAATLSWDAVEGATGYEIKFGSDGNPIAVDGTTYAAANLAPATEHSWTVRTIFHTLIGEWADTATFTTESFNNIGGGMVAGHDYGENHGAGTNNIIVQIMGGNPSYMAYWDIIIGEIDRSPATRYLEIPAGVYPFSDTKEANTVYTGADGLTMLVSMSTYGPVAIEDGTLTVEGNAYEYRMTFYLTLGGGEKTILEFVGAIPIDNPNYVWEYDTLLSPYTGAGTPVNIIEPAGAPTWSGEIKQFESSTDRYEVTGNFGWSEFPSHWDVKDRVLYMDNLTNVGEDAENIYRMSVVVAKDGVVYVTSETRLTKSLVWNPVAKTVTYPATRIVAMPTGTEVLVGLYGIGSYSKATGEWAPASEFYRDITLTLPGGTSGAAVFSGTPVDISGLKISDKRLTEETDTIKGIYHTAR